MNKAEKLKEFRNVQCSMECECKDCEHGGICEPMHVVSGILDEAEQEKQEAVSGIIDFISDQDSIIDSTYKTYELIQSDIEYLKNKYLKGTK